MASMPLNRDSRHDLISDLARQFLIVTDAEADFVVSRLLVAVTVAVEFCVTAAVVYLPEASKVPTLELPPAAPFTDHVTPELSPVTIAVNCTELPAATTADWGETVTVMSC
jgi:hypothetical protein